MHNYKTSKYFDRILNKILKKNKKLYEQILKKIHEIINSDVEHYKNLRHSMKDSKRAHIGHFVIVFKFDKKNDLILFTDFDHYDNIYKK